MTVHIFDTKCWEETTQVLYPIMVLLGVTQLELGRGYINIGLPSLHVNIQECIRTGDFCSLALYKQKVPPFLIRCCWADNLQ